MGPRLPLICSAIGIVGMAAMTLGQMTQTSSPPAPGSSAWIGTRTADLTNSSPKAAQQARQQLIQLAESSRMPATYPADLSRALTAVLRQGNCRSRVNAAVVAERVAAKTASPDLPPLADALLRDRSDSVALWGMKTARPLIASSQAADRLAAAVTSAAKAHPQAVALTEEAYLALTPREAGAPLINAVLPELVNLIDWQLSRFDQGDFNALQAPRPIDTFLPLVAWPVATKAQQRQVLQALGELSCSAAHAIGNNNDDRALLEALHGHAAALAAIGTLLSSAPLSAAAKTLQGITPNAAPAAILAACKALDSALRPLGVILKRA